MQEPQSLVIGEEQKESNPILKVVFNKMRNLRKKVGQIEHIKSLDQRTLKPAQLEKLSKQAEVQEEINKYETFARQYKAILIQNHLSYEKVDDLLKISTILTVGKRVKANHYCPIEVTNVYQQFYNKIFGNEFQSQCKDLSDQVIRVYHLLWNYLENQSNYSQCRDYLSYIEEIDQRMHKEKKHDKHHHHKNDKKVESITPIIIDLQQKIQKLEVSSQILKINLHKSIEIGSLISQQQIEEVQKLISQKEIESKQDASTTNPEGDKQSQELQRQLIQAILHPETVWCKKTESHEENHIDFHSADNKPILSNSKSSRGGNNRERKNRRNKKPTFVEFEYNVRKCSETSLEPTPQKNRAKRKYMEKKQF